MQKEVYKMVNLKDVTGMFMSGGSGSGGKGGKKDEALDFLKMIGPMIDNMIVGVPLEKFEEIRQKNPEAKIVPLMTDSQIKHNETRLMLGLVNMFAGDIPKEYDNMKNGIFKVAFGMAYKIDTDEITRNKFMSYVNRIVDYKGKIDGSKTKVDTKVD